MAENAIANNQQTFLDESHRRDYSYLNSATHGATEGNQMFNFTILFQGAEVACAEADRFEDARAQAIEEASNGFYASALRECEFSATCDHGVIARVTGPLFI